MEINPRPYAFLGEKGREPVEERMPRRPPRMSAVQTANTFVHVFIAESKSDDYILPKNGERLPMSAGFQYCIAVFLHVPVAVGIAYS